MFHSQSSSFPTDEAPTCIYICGALSGRMPTESYSPEPDRSRLSVTEGCWDLYCGKGEAFFILGNSVLAANAGKMPAVFGYFSAPALQSKSTPFRCSRVSLFLSLPFNRQAVLTDWEQSTSLDFPSAGPTQLSFVQKIFGKPSCGREGREGTAPAGTSSGLDRK